MMRPKLFAYDVAGRSIALADGHIDSRAWITHRTTMRGAISDLPLWASNKTGLVKAVIELA